MNEKKLIQALGFNPKENTLGIFHKKYDGYAIEVDFDKKQLNFGDKIKAENKTTQNFSQSENWVVLECVNRLLEKGYQPEHITLEKTWKTGHGTSGRLDILVNREDGSTYLMIECKTLGKEYKKELKNLYKNGGQLFTYFQQDKAADVLMLYASIFNGEAIQYENTIVNIEPEYRETSNVKDFFDRWNKLPKNNGIFDRWVKPYNFESKALTPKDLKNIEQPDSSFIFNQFLEILRHNVVSDKPNAFNKIFTLFLCKIYDEKHTHPNQELAFQWFYTPYEYEGIQYPPDNHVSFQKRLTDLYAKGMNEFLEKEVTDISDADFDKKYKHSIEEHAHQEIKDLLTKIRLEKNNEFAIKEVFNTDSFEENAIVVKEVVELLQGYKIRYTKKQQYLSDFFELLLTTGLKQESGQFFTPVPIAQFIIRSLPLDDLTRKKLKKGAKNDLLPTIIDYASGSGHFITESMHVVQQLIDVQNPDDYLTDTGKKIRTWQDDHFEWAFKYIYGIEKDYRLVKVGKVGCYLHGDGLAQIIHSDGLGSFTNTKEYKGLLTITDESFPKENKQFDVIVSNPPYSVASFKNNARKYYNEDDFEIYDYLTDNNSEIECLFVERTKQLLKDGGLAGIILPSSILNNTGIYTKARQIILEYFEIVGITELGANTFMATGTNTVTLFLRRRNNFDVANMKKIVKKSFTNLQDLSINGIETPLQKYLDHVWENVSLDDYKSLQQKVPNREIQQHGIYKAYDKKIKTKNQAEKLTKILEIEQEKLFYFVLTYPQKVVLIKTGQKNAEKQFLGYEFSNRRGSEGIHPVQRSKSIDECTRLYDINTFKNPEKASTYVYNAFKNNWDIEIPENLQQNISYQNLVDMLTFDSANFEKNISLTAKKKVNYEHIWNAPKLFFLNELAVIKKGKAITKSKTIKGLIPVIAGGKQPAYYHNKSNRSGNVITVSASGAYAGFVNYFSNPIFASDCNTIVSADEEKTSTQFIFHLLKYIQPTIYALQRGQAQPHVYADDLAKIKIPIPIKHVQEKIVAEIEIIDKQQQKAIEKIRQQKVKIKQLFTELKYTTTSLGDISNFKNGLNYNRKSLGELITIIGVGDFKEDFFPNLENLEKIQIQGNLHEDYELKPQDILVVRSNGSARLVGRFLYIQRLKEKTSFSGFTIRIRLHSKDINAKFLCYYLKTDTVRNNLMKDSKGSNIKSLNQGLLGAIKIPLLPLSEQEKIVTQIEKIETQIAVLETQIAKIPKQKEKILKKYLC